MKKLLLLLLLPISCFANNINSTTKSTATLSSSCILNVQDLNFGNYNPSSDSFASASVTTICSRNLPYTIGNNATYAEIKNIKYSYIAGGNNWIPYMKSATSSDHLNFNIFKNSSYTTVFGSSTQYGNDVNNWPYVVFQMTGTGTSQVTTFYGAMPSGQFVTPGNYSSTNTIVISF